MALSKESPILDRRYQIFNFNFKNDSEKIMGWGCFCASGVGHLHKVQGIMDRVRYKQILIHHLRPGAQILFVSNDWLFQQDNDPKHKSKLVMDDLERKYNVLE